MPAAKLWAFRSAAGVPLPPPGNWGNSAEPIFSSGLAERQMADHNQVAYSTADGNDYAAHEQTYLGFLMLVKYGSLAVIAVLVLMAIFLL
jgi:hypothetical protein